MNRARLIGCCFCIGMAVVSPVVRAEDPDEARKEVEGFWPVDSILEQAVRNIARRYNLNDEQTEYTRKMMNERVKRFLDAHQDEIWPLIRDLAIHQRKGAMPEPEVAARLGPVASRIVKEAFDEIFKSNEEWREILTPEQMRVHDFDMREMRKTFEIMQKNFDDWSKGRVSQKGIFPPPPPPQGQPPTPPRPADGQIPGKQKPKTDHKTGTPRFISHLEAYLERFIADYELTDSQQEAGRSILREIAERTRAFRKAHEKELDEIKEKTRRANTREERAKLLHARRKITAPLDDLFREFKQRLEQIPDQAQRARFAKKERDRRTKRSAIGARRAEQKSGQVNAARGQSAEAADNDAPVHEEAAEKKSGSAGSDGAASADEDDGRR